MRAIAATVTREETKSFQGERGSIGLRESPRSKYLWAGTRRGSQVLEQPLYRRRGEVAGELYSLPDDGQTRTRGVPGGNELPCFIPV